LEPDRSTPVMEGHMDAQQIIALIRECMEGATSQERLEEQNFYNAQNDIQRSRAQTGITVNRAQAGILQTVLDDIQEREG